MGRCLSKVNPMLTLPTVLTIGEASKYSGLHRDRIAGAMNKHELAAAYFEGRRFVRPPDLIAWLESQGLKILPGFPR
jgi:hypothetical protein